MIYMPSWVGLTFKGWGGGGDNSQKLFPCKRQLINVSHGLISKLITQIRFTSSNIFTGCTTHISKAEKKKQITDNFLLPLGLSIGSRRVWPQSTLQLYELSHSTSPKITPAPLNKRTDNKATKSYGVSRNHTCMVQVKSRNFYHKHLNKAARPIFCTHNISVNGSTYN